MAAGEDMLADPVGTGPVAGIFLVGHGDRLQGDPAAGGEQPVQSGKIDRQMGMAHRFQHLDGDNPAEPSLHMTVVGELDVDPVPKPLLLHPSCRPVILFPGHRDAGEPTTGAPHRLNGESAPAAADFQDMILWSDGRHGDHGLDLGLLCCRQAGGVVGKEAA